MSIVKQIATNQHLGLFMLDKADHGWLQQALNQYCLVYTQNSQLIYFALCNSDQKQQAERQEYVQIYNQLRMLGQIVIESYAPNFPPSSENYNFDLRENSTSLSLVCDLLFQAGMTNITEKAALLACLEKGSYLEKASDFIQGTQTNTSAFRFRSTLQQFVMNN